jgi:uncharacterized protein YidB (DUF937 family)
METFFYGHVVVPMVVKCREIVTNRYLKRKEKELELELELELCNTVKNLSGWLTNMDAQYKLEKEGGKHLDKTQKMAPLNEIDKISLEIFDAICAHNNELMSESRDLLESKNGPLFNKSFDEIQQVGTDKASRYEAFEEKFEQMVGELKKRRQIMPKMDPAESIQIKLLWFGDDICAVLHFNREAKEKLEFALEVFVANLAVYSLGLDHPIEAGAKGGIQEIVDKWWKSGQRQQIMTNQLASIIESEAVNSSESGKKIDHLVYRLQRIISVIFICF